MPFLTQDDLSPLPADLPTALNELQTLKGILIRERQMLVKIVEKRELDKRSLTGTIKTLNAENEELREQVRELRSRVEKLITKDTPHGNVT